jgi:hypothetical protein
MDGWRPISTAPKDQYVFVLEDAPEGWAYKDAIRIAKFDSKLGAWWDGDRIITPAYWGPFPPRPKPQTRLW